jgi:thiamine pyrophosphokinase
VEDEDQYSTDLTKSVNHIRSLGCGDRPLDVVCLSGLGGRVDQAMSQLHHLYTFQTSPTYADGRAYLVGTEAITFVLKTGEHRIQVKDNDGVLGRNIGIIPLKEPAIISTKGLMWDVEDWKTEFGGQISTSNYVREEWVEIKTDKDVLFTIDHTVGVDPESEE